ncbi:hypothetical protein BQ8482_111771 [Mesorhizobium delmotii]|uniref:Transposase n=1 Tax=Mesorhizobium delmotii TaxID=1631247 RepID=A0A2P9AFD5_9HYPH|nr:hypothetical protein BQ8482_111771 [Mesorhizobium delmotii]
MMAPASHYHMFACSQINALRQVRVEMLRLVIALAEARGSVDRTDQNVAVFKYRDPAPGICGRLPF